MNMNLRAIACLAAALLLAGSASAASKKHRRRAPQPTVQAAPAPRAPEGPFKHYRDGFHEEILALQVQLDRLNLSCGCIDGHWGFRTEVAFVTWQTLQGRPVTGIPDAESLAALGGSSNILETVMVTPQDVAALVSIPSDWEARSRLPSMGYQTLQEMMAERGHATERLIARLNPSLAWPNPAVGSQVLIPAVADPAKKGRREPIDYAASIRISLGRFEFTVFDSAGKLIALFPCSIARDKARRPVGQLTVQDIIPHPNYTYDPRLFGVPGGTKKLIIPPGPNNPVGVVWMALTLPGYGIHGTPLPEQVGHAESHGCFRLANWNALKLAAIIERGIPIVVEEN